VSNGYERRDEQLEREFILRMYETFREHINRSEDTFWKFMSFYLGAIYGGTGLIALLIKSQTNSDLKLFIVIAPYIITILSFIGINMLIERGKWFFRNMLLTLNLELQVLGRAEYERFFPKEYCNPNKFRKIFDHLALIFSYIFLVNILVSIAFCFTNGYIDTLAILIGLFIFGALLLLGFRVFCKDLIVIIKYNNREKKDRDYIKIESIPCCLLSFLSGSVFIIALAFLTTLCVLSLIYWLRIPPIIILTFILSLLTLENYCSAREHIEVVYKKLNP
jgi:hypothetical protein